jgi:S1-C subfamily serine protease
MKSVLKILGIFILGIGGGIFGSQILWPYFVEQPLFYQYRLERSPVYVTEKKEIIVQENLALKNAIEKVEKTVIGVKTETQKGKVIEGSGLVVTSDGLVVTLVELVPQGAKFSFFIEGEKLHYQILKRDLKENLALVKIEKTNLSTTGFANLEKLKLGERVFLIGRHLPTTRPPEAQNLAGSRVVVNEGLVKYFSQDLIETNIFEKNNLAGSVLFDIEGNVLGINKINSEGQVVSLPVSKIKSFTGF